MFAVMAMMMSALAARFGDEIWEVVGKIMYDIGHNRGMEFAATMKIDPTDARSVGRILDLEDSHVGVKGEWVETGKKRAVKRELNCPFGAALALCPDFCTRLISEVERGTFDVIGAKVKDFNITKLISKGDPYCEAIIELED
jgi:predicted ArsR family transcriptional regulator